MDDDFAVCYLVAGMSSRFGGRIKQFAKVGVNDETLIEISMKQALEAGFNKIVFIVGSKTKKPFMEMFGDSYEGVPIVYREQVYDPVIRDKPWGTADAFCLLKDAVDCPFVVCNGDDIYGVGAFKALFDYLNESHQGNACLGYKLYDTLPGEGTVNRGVYELDGSMNVLGIEEVLGIGRKNLDEKGLFSDSLVSMNIFAFRPYVIGLVKERLDLFKESHREERKSECLLPVEVSNLIGEGRLTLKCIKTAEQWFGVTNPEDEDAVRRMLKEKSGAKEGL